MPQQAKLIPDHRACANDGLGTDRRRLGDTVSKHEVHVERAYETFAQTAPRVLGPVGEKRGPAAAGLQVPPPEVRVGKRVGLEHNVTRVREQDLVKLP